MPTRSANSLRLSSQPEFTLAGLYAKHHQRSYPVYLAIVAFLIGIGGVLPFVYVDVGSQARAIVQTTNPVTPVAIAGGGKVVYANLRDNQLVAKGDTLLILDASQVNTEAQHFNTEVARHQEAISDLRVLVSSVQSDEFPQLYSALYQRDYQEFRQQFDEVSLKETFSRRQLERQESLYATGTIATVEIERYRFEYELTQNAKNLLRERQYHVWTQELQRHERELRKLRLELSTLRHHSEALVITAPVSGNLLNVLPTLPGSHRDAGTRIAEISPAGELELAVAVSPSDIGLVREGMAINLEIDAFSHTRWGTARAQVREISRDLTISAGGQPSFLVKCALLQDHLTLPSGHRGEIKKGMTATAHFVLARRNLFQLLHDRVEDWLPNSLNTQQ